MWPDPENWMCVGVAEQIPGRGDLLPATLGEYAVHVRREPDGALSAAYNAQQHGCASVPVQCAGGRKIACPVRSCTFSLDGSPVVGDAPDARQAMAPFLGFNPAKRVPLDVAQWGPFLLVTGGRVTGGRVTDGSDDDGLARQVADLAPTGVASLGCGGWVSGVVVAERTEIESRLRERGDGRTVSAFQNLLLGAVGGQPVGLVVKPVGLGTAEVLLAILGRSPGTSAAPTAWEQLFGDLAEPVWAGRAR
jgi:hypothetical protein